MIASPILFYALVSAHSLLGIGEKHVNISLANVLSVQSLLCALCLFLTFKEHQCIPGRGTVLFVNDNITLSNSEVAEEISDLAYISRERKSAHLEASKLVVFSDEVGKTHVAELLLRAGILTHLSFFVENWLGCSEHGLIKALVVGFLSDFLLRTGSTSLLVASTLLVSAAR